MTETLHRGDLEGLHLLDGIDIDEMMPLLDHCPVFWLRKDENLITAGQLNNHVYLVLRGTLRVHLQDQSMQPVAVIARGESVGEISIIDRQPTSANVIADEDTKVVRISEATLWRICEQCHGFAYNLLRVLAQRLRSGNTVIHKIQELLREYEYDATVDALTGLYNRRWLDSMMWRIMQRCAGNDQPLTVMMIDVDDFKQFNDRYGHLAGDHALHTVARTLLEKLRPEDLVTRYGGEELLTLSPGSNVEGAAQIAERLRIAVSETPILVRGTNHLPTVTISIGIAGMADGDSPESLIERADRALYRAKADGKNRFSM